MNGSWKDDYTVVPESSVPLDANVIRSHVIYKVKKEEEECRRLKARVGADGNQDDLKDFIRSDLPSAIWWVIRLLLCIASLLYFSIGSLDIKAAYMQSCNIQRSLYIRPPRE